MKTTTVHDAHTRPAGHGSEGEHPLMFLLRGVERFFFQPSDPTTLGLIRISAGLVVLYVHLVYCIGLMNYLGPNTMFNQTGPINTTISVVTPLPAALPLFATGLGGLGLLGWCRKRKAQASRRLFSI